jgi:hypothetical protein
MAKKLYPSVAENSRILLQVYGLVIMVDHGIACDIEDQHPSNVDERCEQRPSDFGIL